MSIIKLTKLFESRDAGPMAGSYAIPSFSKKRKHKDTDNLGKKDKEGLSGQPDLEEGMFSAIDQIRQDSKDVRDFVKNVFKDREFKKMSNDKDFIKYLKSVYEGVSEGSFQRGTQSKPPHRNGGLNHHVLTKSKVRSHDGDANFKKKDSGQSDLEEADFDKIEHLKLLNKAMRAMPGSPKQKEIIRQLNKVRKAGGMRPLKEATKPDFNSKGYKEADKLVSKLRSSIFRKLNDDEIEQFRAKIAREFDLKE